MNLKPNSLVQAFLALPLFVIALAAQDVTVGQPPVEPPVPYASVSQLNGMLSQLEQASQSTQGDLGKLRIEKWKTDSSFGRAPMIAT